MSHTLKLSALNALPVAKRQQELERLVSSAAAPRNGQVVLLNERIRQLELRYEMTSSELLARLRAGQIDETAEIAQWLFLLSARFNRAPALR